MKIAHFTEKMQTTFWPSSNRFPATRADALARLAEFEKTASRYSRDRNHVVPDHTNVSRLSPAIRHRLISEEEVAKRLLHHYAFSTVEKFLQEVYWRRYWKDWLALRPQVWTEYLKGLTALTPCEAALKLMAGEGEVAIMNDFARELIETGYLHNHARMWFAGYWIHTAKLPWQIGADFFYRHLLDADPASNTLSWRWVAGIQTPGKTYLARRSNIEKYLHPDLLKEAGLDQFESYERAIPKNTKRPPITAAPFENLNVTITADTGFWLHDEDLSTEPSCERVFLSEEPQASSAKQKWITSAFDDTQSRLNHLKVERSTIDDLVSWAKKSKVSQIIARRPEIGPINDKLPAIRSTLETAGIKLYLEMRPEDLALQSHATAGFFGFWKKIEPQIRALI